MHERHRRQRETDRRNCGDTRRSYHYNVRLKINRPRPRVAWNFIFIHSKIARKVAYSLYTPPSLHVFLGGGVTCTYYKSSRIIASPPAPTGCQSASEVFILKTAVLVWKCVQVPPLRRRHRRFYNSSASQWTVSKVVHGYDMHRLVAFA